MLIAGTVIVAGVQPDAAFARKHFGEQRNADILTDGVVCESDYRSVGDEIFRAPIANCY
jgi:hypothetical protein